MLFSSQKLSYLHKQIIGKEVHASEILKYILLDSTWKICIQF